MSRQLRRLVVPLFNFWSMRMTHGLCSLHALAICLGLTVIVAGCSSDAEAPSESSTDVTGGGAAGEATSSGGAATMGPGAGGARASRGGVPTSGGSSAQSTMVSVGGGGQTSTAASCPTYADDFLPQIN